MTKKLSIKGLAIAGAILLGAYLFLLALISNIGIPVWFTPRAVIAMQTIYPYFTTGIIGAVIGLVYGIICGAVCGTLFGWLYNKYT